MFSRPKINALILRESAERFRDLLQSYSATEPEAELCLRVLTPIFNRAIAGAISEPHKGTAPCGYYFTEGSLRKYRNLEEAFAQFSIDLQGIDSAELEAWHNEITSKQSQ